MLESKDIRVTKTVSQPIQPVFSTTYPGEWVNISLGSKMERKFVKPKITFSRKGGNAIVLGNGNGRSKISLQKFNQSNANKLLKNYNVLYGCNAAFRDEGNLDFLVITNRLVAPKIPREMHGVCYATPEIQRMYPGMDLIPVYQRMDAGTIATMLACYHGADRIFLFGFDGQDDPNRNNNIYAGTDGYGQSTDAVDDSQWHANLYKVVSAYPAVTFYRVDSSPPNSRPLTALPNYRMITLRDFVTIADV